MKTYIRFKQHQKSTPKQYTNETTTEVSPWNDQQYKNCLWGGGLKSILQAPKRIDNTSVALLTSVRIGIGQTCKLNHIHMHGRTTDAGAWVYSKLKTRR